MTAKQLFVDTNVLVNFSNRRSDFNKMATDALQNAYQSGVELIISQQILREYLATATRPNPAGSVPPLNVILANIKSFQADFTVLADNDQVFTNLLNLAQYIPMGGKQIHDANIVATMQAYNITRLLTNNAKHFTRFANLITVVPLVINP